MPQPHPPQGPLEGLRVLDIATVFAQTAHPYTAALLAANLAWARERDLDAVDLRAGAVAGSPDGRHGRRCAQGRDARDR